MQTLRTIIWVIIAIALTIFALVNFQPITVKIWPGQSADTYLPVVMLITFLIGFLPPFLVYRAQRWSMRRTIGEQERVIADLRTMPVAASAPAPVIVHDMAVNPDPVTGTMDDSAARPIS